MEPSDEQLKEFTTLGDVVKFAGGDVEADKWKTFVTTLGAEMSTNPTLLALVTLEEAEKLITEATQLSVLDRSVARQVLYLCRRLGKVEASRDAVAAAAQKTQEQETLVKLLKERQDTTSEASRRKIKLNAVLSQTSDAEVEVLDVTQISVAYARYETVFGSGVRPPADAEPTTEQLTGLNHILKSWAAPYLDFAIWGPHGHRIIRRLRLSGLQFAGDGTLRTIELNGPADLDMWLSCYRLLEVAFVMLDIADLGPLQRYKDMIVQYHKRYGAAVWHLLYQADTRTRLEHMERLHRHVTAEHERITKSGGVSTFDAKRPWNAVWMRAVDDAQWWRNELEEPALIILNRASLSKAMISDDAKTGMVDNVVAGSVGKTASAASTERQVKRKLHEVADGNYVKNRAGHKVCTQYQTGNCEATVRGIWCPKSRESVHLCARCLGQHPANACGHDTMPETSTAKRIRKGDGKGSKGSGRGRGRGRGPQY
jgi:hypothetical protein